MDLRVLILPAKRDAEPVGRNTLDFEVEIAPESPYMAQGRNDPKRPATKESSQKI